MDVARVATRLGWQVRDAVAADDISTQVVPLCKRQFYLRPARNIVGSEADFKWEVPNDPSIRLLTFVRMLAHTTFVTLLFK